MLLAFPIASHLDYFLCSSAADATETSLPSLGSLLSTHFLPDGANYGPGLVMRAGAIFTAARIRNCLLREIARRANWHMPNSCDEARELIRYFDIENLREPHPGDDEARQT